MVAAAGWLQQLMACPGPQRVQVLDEAWALLGNRHTAGYLQTCFKLGRTYGTANLCITHRASDLVAQADDGSSTAKIAAGLLADSATKIILRQAPDQLDATAAHFGLTEPESSHRRPARSWTSALEGRRTDRRGPPPHRTERAGICDTDARMNANHDRGRGRRRPWQRVRGGVSHVRPRRHHRRRRPRRRSPTSSSATAAARRARRRGRVRTRSTPRPAGLRQSPCSRAIAVNSAGAATAAARAAPPSTSSWRAVKTDLREAPRRTRATSRASAPVAIVDTAQRPSDRSAAAGPSGGLPGPEGNGPLRRRVRGRTPHCRGPTGASSG